MTWSYMNTLFLTVLVTSHEIFQVLWMGLSGEKVMSRTRIHQSEFTNIRIKLTAGELLLILKARSVKSDSTHTVLMKHISF